jgi:hypothetical protein
MFKFAALLIVGWVSAAFGPCFGAPAGSGAAQPGCSKLLSPGETGLAEQASNCESELKKQGFNVTELVTSEAPNPFEFLLAPDDDKQVTLLRIATAKGTVRVELHDPNRNLLEQPWLITPGKPLDKELHGKPGKYAPGKYTIDIQRMDGADPQGVIAIKRWAVKPCPPFESNRLVERNAEPSKGYRWPYLLVKPLLVKPVGAASGGPASTRDGPLIVVPNNTGFPSVDDKLLHDSAVCELRSGEKAGPLAIADSLGAPLLMPLFPRPNKPYLQALTRDSLEKQSDQSYDHIDRQLIAMIDDACTEMQREPIHCRADKRVLMTGFSASGMFTNRFTVLHPKQVLAAAVGSPGGWPIAPVPDDQGKLLPYPVGVADLDTKELGEQPVDITELKRVRFLFLLGTEDTNDSVPCRDSFSPEQARLIDSLFGAVGGKCGEAREPVAKRWCNAQRLYEGAGLNARFRLYPCVGHYMTPVMWKDVLEFFREASKGN